MDYEPNTRASVEPDSRPAFPEPSVPISAIPPDLDVPWSWSELLIFVVIAIAATFLVSIVVVLLFSALGVHLSDLRHFASEQSLYAIVSQAIIFFALLSYLAAQMRLRFGMPFWRTIGWRALTVKSVPVGLQVFGYIGGGLLLTVIVQLVSIRFGSKAKLPVEQLFQGRLSAILILLMAVLIAPVVEETIFRGYIYPVIARRFGLAAGVIATGTLFGLMHAPQLWGGWVQIASLIFVGIVLTYARAAKKTVVASYLLHMSYNFFISLFFLIGSHWLRVLTPSP